MRADCLLPGKVTVICANGIGGRQRVIGQLVVLGYLTHKGSGSLPIRQFFSEEGVEHRTAGIKRLQLVLHIKSGEHIFGIAYRQVTGVSVIWWNSYYGAFHVFCGTGYMPWQPCRTRLFAVFFSHCPVWIRHRSYHPSPLGQNPPSPEGKED